MSTRPPSISLHQVAKRRVEVILGLLEGRVFRLALGSRLPRLRRNAEGVGDAGENGHALVHRHDAAYRHAIESVQLWVEDALEDGEKLPRSRSLMELAADREVRRAFSRRRGGSSSKIGR